MTMTIKKRRIVHGVTGAALAVSLAACGGGSSSPTTQSTPRPTPTPPPPPVVVAQGGGSLEAEFLTLVPFTTSAAGSLRATVDWTFASNDIDIALVSGNCSFDQFFALLCPILAISASTTAKPEQITAAGAAAGTYTLFVENVGPGDESIAYQVVLTPGAAAAEASRASSSLPLKWKKVPRGVIELR